MSQSTRWIAAYKSIALTALCLGTQPLDANAWQLATTPHSVVLVELFTSEGCSSCPPADALLRQVNGTRTDAGQLIVGISEHVTYWNSLGWQDPFSAPVNTERQNAYSERFHLEGVYTPQMVINGSEQIVGSDRGALLRALEKERAQPSQLAVHIVSVTLAGNAITVRYSADGEVPPHGVDLMAVVADDADRSSVLRGENSGQTLAHVAVARTMTRVGSVRAAGEHSAELALPSSFQASQKHHLILFAQLPGNGRVLSADTKPI